MNVGDILITNSDEKFVVYLIENAYQSKDLMIYVCDFETQKNRKILLESEIKEVIEKPKNMEFMFLRRRDKSVIDIKEYL